MRPARARRALAPSFARRRCARTPAPPSAASISVAARPRHAERSDVDRVGRARGTPPATTNPSSAARWTAHALPQPSDTVGRCRRASSAARKPAGVASAGPSSDDHVRVDRLERAPSTARPCARPARRASASAPGGVADRRARDRVERADRGDAQPGAEREALRDRAGHPQPGERTGTGGERDRVAVGRAPTAASASTASTIASRCSECALPTSARRANVSPSQGAPRNTTIRRYRSRGRRVAWTR